MQSAAPENLSGTVIRGIGLAGVGHVLTQALTFMTYVVLARILVPADFGKFVAGSIFVGVGMLFVDSGMLAALVSRRDRIDEAASTALVATMVGGLGLSLLGLAAAPLIGLFFHSREIGLVAAAMSASFILRQATIVPGALLQRNLSFLRRAVFEPAAALAFGATAIGASAMGMGIWSLVFGSYASYATDVGLSWMLTPWRPDVRLASFAMWHELIGFGKHVTAAEFLQRVSSETSTALVGRFLGASALGQYQYAYRIASRPGAALTDSISYVLFPAFTRISSDEARFQAAVLRALRWMSVVALPASLILLPLGEPLVVILFGEQWREAGRAVTAMFAFPAGGMLLSLGAHVAAAAGRPSAVFRMQIVTAALLISWMVALLHFGLLGVAAALSVATLGGGVYSLIWISRLIHAPVQRVLREIWPPTAAAIAMAAALYSTDRYAVNPRSHGTAAGLLLLLLEGLLGSAIFLAVLGALAPNTVRELGGGLLKRLVLADSFGAFLRSRAADPASKVERSKPRLLVVSYLAKDPFSPRGIRTRELLKHLRRDWEIQLICAPETGDSTRRDRSKPRLPRPVRWLIQSLLIDPDELWSIRHLWFLRSHADAALLVGYPFSTLAYASSRLARQGTPYLVDVGDPWALTARSPRARNIALFRSRRAETRMWKTAAGAIVTTAAQATALRTLFPRLEILVRPNGVDLSLARSSDRGNLASDRSPDVLSLAHFGTIYDVRVDANPFLERLLESRLWNRIEFHQYGQILSNRLNSRPGFSLVVHDPLPWREIVTVAGAYDAALVLGNLDGGQLPSKAVDYLLLPIARVALTLDPDRDAIANYVADKPGWLVLRPEDADGPERVCAHVRRRWCAADLLPPASESWACAAAQVTQFLWDVLRENQAGSNVRGPRIPTQERLVE